jgi:Type IV secretory system Conjugative DNA transfer
MARAEAIMWRQVSLQRPVEPVRALVIMRHLAADERSPQLVFETRSTSGGIHNLIGGKPVVVQQVSRLIEHLLPGTTVIPVKRPTAGDITAAGLRASTRHRSLRVDEPLLAVRSLAAALAQVRDDEQLIVQLVLGPRRIPLSVGTNSPSSVVAPWWNVAWYGNGKTIDSEKRAALRTKIGDHGFACAIRIGVVASTAKRRSALLLNLLAALRTSESAGLRLKLVNERSSHLRLATTPWRWPLRLNVQELLGLLGWPLGNEDLPGYATVHPKRLPPTPGTTGRSRMIADSPLAGHKPLAQDVRSALHHSLLISPTGGGKSTLCGGLICQDIEDGRAVVVIEPKGDLVADVLARIPKHRVSDVVLLDPTDPAPVGLNPIQSSIRSGGDRAAELAADSVLAVFRQLYGAAVGPRSADILHAGLLTLARRPDASLVMLPLLLTNAAFRRSITAAIHDPIALGPFWAAYENWSEPERAAAIAPVMNKLRPLLRPGVRAVLGQRSPRFDLRQVFAERKILLVPLSRGQLGPEAASLLGSLVVARLWQAIQARSAVAPERRHPVMVYIDEVQDFLHLPTDIGDALAQARGLGVGFTLAHQFLGQLSPELRSGVLANARSRICFQLAHEDAVVMSKGHPELEPADLTALGQYEIYASLFSGGQVTPYASGITKPLGEATADVESIRAASRQRYGRPLDEIEASFAELLQPAAGDLGATGRRRRAAS